MDDDLSQGLTGNRTQTPLEERWHQEMRRKQYDIIRVKNPTNEDFYVKYDTNQHQRVPANGTVDIPRYIAERYCTHMTDQIIHTISQKMHDDHMKERAAKGFRAFESKAEENEATYLAADYPKTNDPKVASPIWDELWVGLVSEVGRDVPPQIAQQTSDINKDPFNVAQLKRLGAKRVESSETPIIQTGIPTTPVTNFVPREQTPQAGFIPQQPDNTPDFTALNETLSRKIDPADVTNND